MKRLSIAVTALLAYLLITPATLLAHHSVGGTFDAEKPVSVEGVVTKVEWFNPHIWIYVSVTAADGSNAEYQCEGSSPNSLRRRGWSKDSLKQGDNIAVEGILSRSDPYSCYAQVVRLEDGTRLFSGSASELR